MYFRSFFSIYWMDTVMKANIDSSGKIIKITLEQWTASGKCIKREGIKGFYNGFGANAIRSLGAASFNTI